MAISLTGDGIQYNGGLVQKYARPIIKYRMSSGDTVDQKATTSWTYVSGTEINMGVPKSSLNWYRTEYYSCVDDTEAQNGGIGFALYRHTPSSGWNLIQAQGNHANYDNNLGDYYASAMFLCYAPVHQTYPTEVHTFRIYAQQHNSQNYRINSGVGYDNRVGGWINNMFEVMELDFTLDTQSSGSLTRY